MDNFFEKLKKVKFAGHSLALLSAAQRRGLLLEIAIQLRLAEKEILKANYIDVSSFSGAETFTERLQLDSRKFSGLVNSVKEVASQPDVIGKILEQKRLRNGLILKKISVPLGVVGVIYESRPNVTVDLAALAIKSGNAIVLKGGKESYKTNLELVKAISKALKKFDLLKDAVFLIDPESKWRKSMLNAHGLIDVLVPRGGAKLIEFVRKNARIPIIETGAGVCHTFVDESCSLKKAVNIVINAKVQRPGVCNALDTLVVHKKIMKKFINQLAPVLAGFGVEVFADPPAYTALANIYPAKLLKKASVQSF
ncbi:MAG: glutamate-5-semialdehyde dehydrogenase, partial [Patescibacteria group bacterium]